MAEQFPAKVRVTGVALPYAISVTLFGGTAPYIMTAMTNAAAAAAGRAARRASARKSGVPSVRSSAGIHRVSGSKAPSASGISPA